MSSASFPELKPDDLERLANDFQHLQGERGEKPQGSKAGRGANGGRIGAKRPRGDNGLSARMIAAARATLRPRPESAIDYPSAALGPLGGAALAIAQGAQLRPAMAGQSVLAVAALLAQAKANVRSLDGIKPLSLYALTIGESGDGKSTADRIAQTAVQARQRRDSKTYRIDVEAWETAPKKERGDPPREPYRVIRDGTVEGIRRSFAAGLPAQGVFSSEAAAVLCGYGMRPEHRAKTAGTLNAIWDDGQVSVARALTGRLELYGRRLSIHWLIQPSAAEEALSDPSLTAIGFWPRFMAAWPEPSAPRLARQWRADEDSDIGQFWNRCTEIMDEGPPDDCSNLRTLGLSPEAADLLGSYFERMEAEAKGHAAKLGDIKPFALRATEHAVRVAGVLSVFADDDRVSADAARNGIAIAWHSLKTWAAIFGDRDQAASADWALTLFAWWLAQPEWTATETAMLRIGPKALRSRSRRDTALALLEAYGFVSRSGTSWSVEELAC